MWGKSSEHNVFPLKLRTSKTKSVYAYKYIYIQTHLLCTDSLIHSSHTNLYKYYKVDVVKQIRKLKFFFKFCLPSMCIYICQL